MKKMSLILFIVFISNVFLAQEGENRQTISMINSSKVGEVIFSHSSFRTLYHDIEQTNLFSYFKEDLNGFQVSINQFNETKEIPLSLILLKNNENQTHIGVSLFKEVVYSNQIDFILDNSLIINNTDEKAFDTFLESILRLVSLLGHPEKNSL